jgi:hypothetical protein
MKKTKKKDPASFFLGMAVPLILCTLMFGFSAVLLTRAGEYASLDRILDKQMRTGGVYGSPLYQRTYYYKQRIYERTRPEVAVLGSSRVLQFQAQDFRVSFANLGSMSSLDEVSDLARAVFGGHKPSLLILGVDFWWFLGDGKAAAFTRDPPETSLRLRDVFMPFSWLLQGKLKPRDIRLIFAGGSPNIGVSGITLGDGHDRAGAYYYTSIWTGSRESDDYQFRSSFAKIKKGAKIYAWSDRISDTQWKKFTALLDDLQRRGIPTVLLLPPLAPPVLDVMRQSGKYGYIDGLRLRLSETAAAYNMPLYDDHDLRFAGASACEFIDGHHGGAIVYKRILLDMAGREPQLAARVDAEALRQAIGNFRGRASLLPDETDFLGLGCPKPAQSPKK